MAGFNGLRVLLLAVFGIAIYLNSLTGPFHFDDLSNIRYNPSRQMSDLSLDSLTRAAFAPPCSNRPIANLSFALNHYLHDFDVVGYHVTNMAVHVLTGIFLYALIQTTLANVSDRSKYGENGSWIAFFGALLWMVHPVHTQAVVYIVQRMTGMAGMFYVLAMLLYVKARYAKKDQRRWPWLGGAVLAGLLAFGTKEIAVTLPFFVLLYEWYFIQDLSPSFPRQVLPYVMGAGVVLAVLVLLYVGPNPFKAIAAGYANRDFSLTERVLTEFRVVIYYMSLLIYPLPSRLNLDYDFSLSRSLVDPITTLLALTAIVGLVLFALYLAKRDRFISFAILWFFGNLALESSVIPLEIAYEHRNYLPSMFLFSAALVIGFRVVRRRQVVIAVAGAAVVLLSLSTYQRNKVWKDPVALWTDCVSKSGKKARVHNNLGLVLAEHGRLEEAAEQYLEAVRLDPDYGSAHSNLGSVLAKQHQYEKAIEHFVDALRITPGDPKVHYNLADALAEQGRVPEAVYHYSEAVRIKPDYAKAHNNLGRVLAMQGDIEGAMAHFADAVRIDPDYAGAHLNLAIALSKKGRFKEALEHGERAAALGAKMAPGFLESLRRYGQ